MKEMTIQHLFDTINDDPDPLHVDYTPSVHQLIGLGRLVLLPALELMLSPDEMTRLRAQRVIEGVILVEHGFVFGRGWRQSDVPAQEEAFRSFWQSLGNLDYQQSLDDRKKAVALWRAYLQ